MGCLESPAGNGRVFFDIIPVKSFFEVVRGWVIRSGFSTSKKELANTALKNFLSLLRYRTEMIERIDIENIERFVKHWIESSDRDFKTMQNLYKSKDYCWALFIGHLVIEKLLKAFYIKNKQEHPIPIHDLTRIAAK